MRDTEAMPLRPRVAIWKRTATSVSGALAAAEGKFRAVFFQTFLTPTVLEAPTVPSSSCGTTEVRTLPDAAVAIALSFSLCVPGTEQFDKLDACVDPSPAVV
ncbi:hypothetical protein PHYPSEUDO_004910 [Phytophthora pseudosyringae]|uniref:Uncharacterized protein n=1 Tax=Phytophthora pseudosyringae TaxID=221518 RepID=A0A8T1WDT7_9STRA|nr:hypothetical protein PHYPSEUDO_004910 [Phytophthora pseudosyringae]